jgi:Protein of unknown function (DUF4197)
MYKTINTEGNTLMSNPVSRRMMIHGLAAAPVLIAVSGCSGTGFSLVEAIRRLLSAASQRAFAGLLRENGFFDDAIARIDLPASLGGERASTIIAAALRSGPVRERMLRQVNRAAEKGAEIAAPLVTNAIQSINFEDALAIVKGSGSAATDALKGQMGSALFNAMIPGIDNGLRLFDDRIVQEALRMATGINFAQLRDDVSQKASNAIYKAIGREEIAIRADPSALNDPLVSAVFKIGAKL